MQMIKSVINAAVVGVIESVVGFAPGRRRRRFSPRSRSRVSGLGFGLSAFGSSLPLNVGLAIPILWTSFYNPLPIFKEGFVSHRAGDAGGLEQSCSVMTSNGGCGDDDGRNSVHTMTLAEYTQAHTHTHTHTLCPGAQLR